MSTSRMPPEDLSAYERDDIVPSMPSIGGHVDGRSSPQKEKPAAVATAERVLSPLPTLKVTQPTLISGWLRRKSLSVDNLTKGSNRRRNDPLNKIKNERQGKSGSLLHLNLKRSSLPVPGSNSQAESSTASERSAEFELNSGEGSPNAERSDSRSESSSAFSFEPSPAPSPTDMAAGSNKRTSRSRANWSSIAKMHQFFAIYARIFVTCPTCSRRLVIGGYKCRQCGLYAHARCMKHLMIACGQRNNQDVRSYGVPLEASIERVPLLVRKCVYQIECRGSTVEGIYSDSTLTPRIRRIIASLNYASSMCDLMETPVHDIAIALKIYFKELPEPLFSLKLQNQFLDLASKYNQAILDPIKFHQTIPDEFRRLLMLMPDNHRATLAYMAEHLHKISVNAKYNRMSAQTLATVIAPVFFQLKSDKIFSQSPYARCTEMLITHSQEILGSSICP